MLNFQRGDLKYYYQIHRQRQKALGNTPISYSNFVNRLKKMTLFDAIHLPRAEFQVRDANKTPIQNAIRRRQTLKDENVILGDFIYVKRVEEMNKIKMPKPKKTLLQKIISWIKKK